MNQSLAQALYGRNNDHDTLVRRAASALVAKGATSMHVDLPDCQQPESYEGSRPDITCMLDGRIVIAEVETSDSLSSHHSMGQIDDFRRFAAKWRDVDVYLVVPSGLTEIQAALQYAGMGVRVIGV